MTELNELILGDPIRLALAPVYTALLLWFAWRRLRTWRTGRAHRAVVMGRLARLERG